MKAEISLSQDKNGIWHATSRSEGFRTVRGDAVSRQVAIANFVCNANLEAMEYYTVNATKEATLEELLDKIRDKGHMVACHNDYVKDGELWTFWLFTKPHPEHDIGFSVKGEARTDVEALNQIWEIIK